MSKVDYADYHILTSEVSPPSANTLGSFKIVINDEGGQAGSEFGDKEPVWIYGKVGYKAERMMRGVVERVMQVQLRGDQQGLQLAGRSWGAYLEIRAVTTSVTTSGEIRNIIINNIAPLVPELNFGNYVYSTGVSLGSYTLFKGASVWFLLKELAGLASTPSTQWGVWDCDGSHAGENGVPNVHFGPIKQETSLVPIVNLKYVYRTLSPLDYRQIVTRAIIGYDDGTVNTFLPNNFLTVDATGPGVGSAYSGSFNGTNTTVTFPDTYLFPHQITSNGGASIDTSQSVFGGASGKFVAASSQYLSVPDSNDWFFGTGDFTIDFRVRFNTLPASGAWVAIYSQYDNSNNEVELRLYNNAGTYQWREVVKSAGVGPFITIGTTITTGTWYHIAWVRSGNLLQIYQAGTQLDSTDTGGFTAPDLAGTLDIGTSGGSGYFDGWLDEFRVSKGVARWTANFTPPTAPYVTDDYTVFLAHMKGANAGTSFYDSAYPTLNFAMGDSVTLESWVYFKSLTGFQSWIQKFTGTQVPYFIETSGGTEVVFGYRNVGDTAYIHVVTSGAGLTINTWYHIVGALTFGTPSSAYVMINGVKQNISWTVGTGNEANIVNTTSNVYIGITAFNGYIDNAYIWPRYVTLDEAIEHYKGTFKKGAPVLYVPFEENGGSIVYDKSGYGFIGTPANLTWFNYGNTPSSQPKYGVIAQRTDRIYGGLTEATNFANLVLRNSRDAVRYVEADLPLDLRLKSGQWVYVYDKAYRGRAILSDVTHFFDEDPRTKATLIYI